MAVEIVSTGAKYRIDDLKFLSDKGTQLLMLILQGVEELETCVLEFGEFLVKPIIEN